MTNRTKRAIVIGAFAAILAIGAGAAVAGGGLGDDQQAFLNNAAKRLNVTPAQLEAALKGAYDDQVDAAVAAGKLTKEQGEALKQRTAEGRLPLFGGHRGPHGGLGFHGPASLDAAAAYLGLTEAELHAQLESGKTLAEIAKAEGKSVEGLEKAITADVKAKLDAAVEAGKLTQAQADEALERMTDRLDDLVNGTLGSRPGSGMHPGGHGHGWGGPALGVPDGGTEQGSGAFTPIPA